MTERDDRPGPRPGDAADAFRDLVTQLGEFAARIASTGAEAVRATGQSGAGQPRAGLNDVLAQLPMPVAQLESVVREIRSRREQTQAVRAQLAAFDEQLAALEATLVPVLEWTRTWARLQRTLVDPFGVTGPPEDRGR